MMTLKDENKDSDDDEESDSQDTTIHWSNLMFLPFNTIFKELVLTVVVFKTILGPIQSVYPIVYCWNTLENNHYSIIETFYVYFCDTIYGIDTFLHILHRQVTDEAVRREYLPKSAFLLLLDIISLIPFYRLTEDEVCPPIQLWPNILSFSEFVIIYRVGEYYSLLTSHNYLKLTFGFTLILGISLNCLACFMLLLTSHGLCSSCNNGIYDWRQNILHKLNETDVSYSTYVYGATTVISYIINKMFDETKPCTIVEYIIFSIFLITGNILLTFVVFPKMFAEQILRYRRMFSFYPHVHRMIKETKRRNTSRKAYAEVQHFYTIMWKRRGGITWIPDVINELPRYLRIDIRQDLVWPIFYHSPTLRNTSDAFKRGLCENVRIDYKLPEEKFYAGPHCYTHLYYLKSGIVQLISSDDGTTPLLSVTSGTIFGDICFHLPTAKKKIHVKCLTYCEVLYISRLDLLSALNKYPDDRINILQHAKDRIRHARTLYTCKQNIRGLDRTEDEGIAWVKRRWWEISDAVTFWKKKNIKKENCELPPEEAIYHCAKHIGQLVLCSDIQLQMKSMFANVKFPFLFVPESVFLTIWRRIVIVTVVCVLLVYPPYLSRANAPKWFYFFQIWTDVIYIADICVSLLTARHEIISDDFAAVMFARCKSINFIFDALAASWIESLLYVFGYPEYYIICQFNRLLKVYILFTDWDIKKDPLLHTYINVGLVYFCFVYIISYVLYTIHGMSKNLTFVYFFGEDFCDRGVEDNDATCNFDTSNPLTVVLAWILEFIFNEYGPSTLIDIYFEVASCYLAFLVYIYCKTKVVASLYLKYREIANYQYFVSNVKSHYLHHKIHPNLLMRLDRYLVCHWKYYKGMDVMYPNLLQNEPYDIYWKVQGEVAEKVIRESMAFTSAAPALIKELAYKAKFLVLPKNSTVFLFGLPIKAVTWLVQGHIACEYPSEKGILVKKDYNPGDLLTSLAVFFNSVSLRTLSAYTECEILYINVQDFFNILKHHPIQWAYFEQCIQEFRPQLEKIVHDSITHHKKYEKNLRSRIFHGNRKVRIKEVEVEKAPETSIKVFTGYPWICPDSELIHYWMLFRAVIVFVSIISAAVQGCSGANNRRPFMIIGATCDCIAVVDIILKLFLGFYDERGLLITDWRKCFQHYASRGLLFDLIGCMPCVIFIQALLTKKINENDAILINTLCKFAHLYLLTGYFDYVADMPNVNFAILMILKWQVVTVLVMFGAGHYFVNQCVRFKWTSRGVLVNMTSRKHCWYPKYLPLESQMTLKQLHMICAASLNLAQNGFMRFNLGKFHINRHSHGVGTVLFALGFLFWFVMCYSLTLLVLNHRGNTLFQHGVSQLQRFLNAERVDKKLITRAVAHFRYWWLRTKGINIQSLMNERIGVVFRQDLSYYFFRKTVEAASEIFDGGERLERELASASTQLYFRPGEAIVREMDLSPWVFIVHRGIISIHQGEEKLALLTKGSIFGQLEGTRPRPIRITGYAEDYADLLQIGIQDFQQIIDKESKEIIKKNPQSKYDYLAVKNIVQENPYNTIRYILRGKKSIKLPWMDKPIKTHTGTWYTKWLYVAWLTSPVLSAILALLLISLPETHKLYFHWALVFMDIIQVLHFISEFYEIELIAQRGKCTLRVIKWRFFKKWQCYIDIISIIVPMCWFLDIFWQNFGRFLRLRLLYDFHVNLCKGFHTTFAPALLKLSFLILLLHSMSCIWICVACREEKFPLEIPELLPHVNATIDYTEWTVPNKRVGGCPRISRTYKEGGDYNFGFLVPKHWAADYIIAMFYTLIIYAHAEIDVVLSLTIQQVYFKIFVSYILYPIEIWVLSVAISAVCTKSRELYAYDYDVKSLIKYLEHSGLSSILLESVKEYTQQLWKRQRGNWLPELAQQAPYCLREDLLGALYIHHLELPPLFRELPQYFTRQLAAKFQRVVIFPGKFIVQEGDIFSCMYFIHEGEVEKWYTMTNGEKKLVSVLTTNGYFGLFPGLFPDTPFQFSYFSRTVVDLIFLKIEDWQELLDGYPDVRRKLYTTASQFKKEFGVPQRHNIII